MKQTFQTEAADVHCWFEQVGLPKLVPVKKSDIAVYHIIWS